MWVLVYFAVTSCICYVLMLLDKRRAQSGAWRIPERTLIFWAVIGGAFGGKVGQRRFRHKTR